MTLEPQHVIGIMAIVSTILVFLFGLFMNRRFRTHDDHEERIHDLELSMAAHYPNRDAVDAAVSRAMEPLRDSIDRQETKVDELSSLVLKMLHRQGID